MIVGMRRLAVAPALVLLVVATSVEAQVPRVVEPEQSRPWAVYFSPGGGAAQAVVEAVGRAAHTVLVQTAVLGAPQITKALVDAQHRGVKVEVILDRKQA
jgi:phosphatidylserine/phosphatidylglycerophosphate/cardiolipin synthase-like enzyme